jgi:hypothetical protein
VAHNVNVTFGNYSASGANVTMPQVSMDVTVNWRDEAGPHTNTQTVLFPNILSQVPVAKRDDVLQQIILLLLRLKLGIDA